MQSTDYAVRPSVCLLVRLSRRKRDGRPNTPTGTPPNGGGECKGMKNHDFRQISRFVWEMMQDRAIVTMEGE